jgi:catalase (peroxidase I)
MLLLQDIKNKYGDGLSWADLIMLAGNTGLEEASGGILKIPFTGGRVDALESEIPYPDYLELRLNGGDQDDTVDIMKDVMLVWGLSMREGVALIAGGHSIGRMHENRNGFVDGSWTTNPTKFDTEYLSNLLTLKWNKMHQGTDLIQYNATNADGKVLYMLRTDLNMRFDAEFESIAEEFLSVPENFYEEFLNAWTKITTADVSTADTTDSTAQEDDSTDSLPRRAVVVISVVTGAVIGAVIMYGVTFLVNKRRKEFEESPLYPRGSVAPKASLNPMQKTMNSDAYF